MGDKREINIKVNVNLILIEKKSLFFYFFYIENFNLCRSLMIIALYH